MLHRIMASCLLSAFAVTLSAAEPLPVYRFEVGQELTYAEQREMPYSDGTFLSCSTWQFWVVSKNSDDTWRMMVRRVNRRERVKKDADLEAAKIDLKKKLADQEDDGNRPTIGRFNIDQHGRISGLSTWVAIYAPVTEIFVSLPKNPVDVEQGWEFNDSARDERFNCRFTSVDKDHATIESIVASAQNDCFEIDEKITAKFERERGIPVQNTVKTTQNYAPKGYSNSTSELVSIKRQPTEWSRRFAEEVEACFTLIEEYDRTLSLRSLSPEEYKRGLEGLRDRLDRLSETLLTDSLQAAIKQKAKQWTREMKFYISDIEDRSAMLDAPSLEWSTKDLAGKEYSLADFRGKVVILDFWYRGCGWCIFAMPQIKEVARHYKDQPVAVLGMNKGDTLENAMLVINKLKLEYLNLEAEEIAKQYKIHGFPTLLILDQEGKIRDVHIGYSPNLKAEIIETVDSLLNSKPQ